MNRNVCEPSAKYLADTRYRQTEIGLIPSDWQTCRMDRFANRVSSGKSKPNNPFGSYPVYGSTGVIGYTDTPEYEGDAILVARVGANAGALNVVCGMYGVTDNTIVLRLREDIVLSFVYRQLESKRLNLMAFGSGQPLITGTQLKALQLVVPRAEEQRAIATALSDVDALIAGLELLIAKKRDIKQATMQQLLTGQTRLPGFSGEWRSIRLADLAKIEKGQIMTTDLLIPGDVPVIAGGKRPAYFHTIANREGMTITVSASGASAGYVAFHRKPIFASDCSTISEDKNYSIEFLFCSLLNRQEVIYGLQTGGAQPHVQPKDLAPLPIPMPPNIQEQTAIATVLSDMDTEIEALEVRLAKTRAIKQGIMQELLTGRTRLLAPDAPQPQE
jgi:type I restriction enzyme, S subunit